MALLWEDKSRKDRSGNVVSECYKATIPGWGKASVHPHIHCPGEMFLDCHRMGIEMHSLGQVEMMDALNLAESVLLQKLKQYETWCQKAIAAISSAE